MSAIPTPSDLTRDPSHLISKISLTPMTDDLGSAKKPSAQDVAYFESIHAHYHDTNLDLPFYGACVVPLAAIYLLELFAGATA